jgi:electron transport complex protein RnfG
MMREDAKGREDAKELPVTPGQAYDPAAEGGGSEAPGPGAAGGPDVPEMEDVPSWRLITTLALAGALAGLLIVGVYQWAQPQILANRAEVLRAAIQEVLGGPDHVQTLYVVDDSLAETPPAGVDTLEAERVFLGFDEAGAPVGYAVTGEKAGFQDIISLIFGYDAQDKEVLGMRVLESKETPGLGDKIYKDTSFVAGFNDVEAPLVGVKDGADAPDEVDLITGATISSSTVVGLINERLEAVGPLLEAYLARREGGGGS